MIIGFNFSSFPASKLRQAFLRVSKNLNQLEAKNLSQVFSFDVVAFRIVDIFFYDA